jgi:hypothetical protein
MVCSLVSNAGKPTFCGLKRFFAFKYNCMDEMNECMNGMYLNENSANRFVFMITSSFLVIWSTLNLYNIFTWHNHCVTQEMNGHYCVALAYNC